MTTLPTGQPDGAADIAAILAQATHGDSAGAAPAPDLAPGESEAESAAPAAGPRALGFDVEDLNREYGLVLVGSKAVIMCERASGPIEDRLKLISIDAFKSWLQNTYTEVQAPDGKVKGSTFALRWLSHPKRRQYSGIEFFPNPDGAQATTGYLNLWRGFSLEPVAKPGAYAIFRDHLLNNVCEGDEYLFLWVFGWFAHMMQRPRERIGTALVLRGRMGTGKTKLGEVFGSMISAHYFAVDDPRYVTGQFNAHMAACILLQAEEAVWAGDKAAEGRLKGLVTSKFQMIEAKGIDPIRIDNHVRLLMTSNEDWVVPAGKDERRFCVLDVNPRCAQNTDYFKEMDEELDKGGRAALLHDLLTFDLSRVDLRRIPRTAALLEQKMRSLDSIDSWWMERCAAGATTVKGDTWQRVIPVETLHDDYLLQADKVGVRRKSEQTAFGIRMNKLVPGLTKTRIHIEVSPAVMRRAWCYQLPPLEVCRAALVDDMGQEIDWGEPMAPDDSGV